MSTFLETKRLILKTPELSDLNNLIALRSDPDVMKYIGKNGAVQTKEEVEKFLTMAIQYHKKHGFGFCSVFEKCSGNFIGQAGLFHLSFHDPHTEIEIAFLLHKKFWGKGYATELARALIQWGFQHLPNKRLVALFEPEDVKSRHVLEKAGMYYTGKVLHNNEEIPCYEIYKNDAIELVPYDTEWQKMAELEIRQLRDVLPAKHILDIQHVGSTAIPGITAKPIIDIQIAVDSLPAIKQIAIDILETQGYAYWYDNPDKERMFFVKGMPPFGEKRSHHVHIVEPASKHWQGKIQFRDYLIAHPEAAQEYENLKLHLAQEYPNEREQYTEGKAQFVNRILKESRKLSSSIKQKPTIIFLTGASGAGKTTLLNTFNKIANSNDVICYHFDSIGVPSEAEMVKTYGSGSAWQKAMTYHWVQSLVNNNKDKKWVLIEGQVNIDFITDAFVGFNFHQYKIMLVHCDNTTRHQRLNQHRNQPELINPDMDNWAAFLKTQALEKQSIIIDTSLKSVDELAIWLLQYLKQLQ